MGITIMGFEKIGNYNLDEIFELESVDYTQVIIKVVADNPLKVARFPFVSSDYAYITVTRGENHTLTVIKDDGKTFGFYWGNGGHTLINNNLEELRKQVEKFIEDNNILLSYAGEHIKKATIYYNPNYKAWQLSLDLGYNLAFYFSRTAHDIDTMIEDAKRFVIAEKWQNGTAQTGIDVWTAISPTYVFK